MAYSRAYNLVDFIEILESWGLTDVLVPFLLIFVVFFAIFMKTKMLGENKGRYAAVFSLVISLMVVVPHVLGKYPTGYDVVDLLNKALPNVMIIVVAMVVVLLFIGILGGDVPKNPFYLTGAVVISFGALFVIFAYPDLTPLMMAIALIVLVVAGFGRAGKGNAAHTAVIMVSFLVVLFSFLAAQGSFTFVMDNWLGDKIYQGLIITILIVGCIMGWAMSGDDNEK